MRWELKLDYFMLKDLRELMWMNISSCAHTNSYNFFVITVFHTDRHFALGVHYYVQSEWFSFVSISMRDKRVTLCRKARWMFKTNPVSKTHAAQMEKSGCVGGCVCGEVCAIECVFHCNMR